MMLTIPRLIGRNLRYYWRTNLAVLIGVIAGTAVISGALVVGDSVRDSLRQMSLDRLGEIDHVLSGGRFFREELAEDLQQGSKVAKSVAPALVMQGTAEFTSQAAAVRRVGQIAVYGVDDRLWRMTEAAGVAAPQAGEVVVNQQVADQLGLKKGDRVSLVVEIPAAIPRDALLGEREETVTELVLRVSGIVPNEAGLARLGLNPTQQMPNNVFVFLPELQSAIGLNAVARSRSNPVPKPARVNALFVEADPQQRPGSLSFEAAHELSAELGKKLSLSDLALRIVENESHHYLSLESEQMYLEQAISDAALQAAQQMDLVASPVLVSLVNEITQPGKPDRHSMYSVVAGMNPVETAPFGPFEFVGEHAPLEGNRIYLNEWLAQDLEARVGDQLRVTYHVVGDRGELPEEEHTFEIAGIVRITGPADDRGFAPEVPGVTDAKSYDDWREPFPLKKDRITDRDDEYWDDYRTTPKLFVSLETAQNLWRSRYGELTSVRFAPRGEASLSELRFTERLLKDLNPAVLGLSVQPVKQLGLDAAQGTTDFTGLFIGFSFFLILSAMLLVGLLFRLGIEQRLQERGLLSAIGLSPRQLRRVYLLEGLVLVLVGGLLGSVAAVAYAAIMIHGLKTWWSAAIGTQFLFVSVHPISLLSGFLIAVIVALGAVWWGQRERRDVSVRQMLNGEPAEQSNLRAGRWGKLVAATFLGGSAILLLLTLADVIPDAEAFAGFSWQVVLFFLVGTGLLIGTLALVSVLLNSHASLLTHGRRTAAEARLGWRNAARNRARSLLTASLIACATFVIVAVGAGQQNPLSDVPRVDSGNGGFTLVAETHVPILYDLNDRAGQTKLGFDVLNSSEMELLGRGTYFPFRVKRGEDASCLNLYQTQLPTILGVPQDVIEEFTRQGRFQFADTRSDQPWELLNAELPDGRIPVLGDMNTLMYSLHKGIGGTINVQNDADSERVLEIRGMLFNSVFQGMLLMSEKNFRKLFPGQAGFEFFLIEVPPDHADALAESLETRLGDYGFDAEPVAQRLAMFLSVQNTYLSTFQTLGGLGLLLGTVGLATVMLRNVLERRGELALLRAVGFEGRRIGRMVLWENAWLLGAGLLAGTLSALIAMSPHLRQSAEAVPWFSLLGMLLLVFAAGMLAALVAVRAAVTTPIIPALRGE